jgi:NADH:ubiquinone oxidoreductase subunit 6 (subunit J)
LPLDWVLIIFLVFAGFTIVSALMVVFSKEIVRNVVWMAMTRYWSMWERSRC